MLLRVTTLLLSSLLSGWLVAKEEAQAVHYFQADLRYEYDIELLQLALDLTEQEYGPAKATPKPYPTHLRGFFALTRGQIDVAFLGTSERYERDYLAVKIPILQGMLGYRLLMTTKERKEKIGRLRTLQDLQQKAIASYGVYWDDARVLRHNELLTIEHANYDDIFKSLHKGEADYVPRGVNEVFNELEAQQAISDKIIVNPEVVLFYPHLRYFFVTRYNAKLAERLEKGLYLALENGRFKALFDKHYSHIRGLLEQYKPHMIVLENPYQTKEIPKVRTEWWLPASQASMVNYSP